MSRTSETDAWTNNEEVRTVEDITARTWASLERTRTEEALRTSEEKYHNLFNSIDEGFCIIEMLFDESGQKPVDYRFLEANPAFERHTGLVNAMGRRVRELVPAHEEHWFQIYGRIALTGEPARFENAAQQLGRYYDVYAFRIGEPHERKVAVLFTDITKRKRVESNARFLSELDAVLTQLTFAEEIEQTVIERVAQFLGVSRCYFMQIKGGLATVQHEFRGENISESLLIGEHPLKNYILPRDMELFLRGETLVVADVSEDPRTSQFVANFDRLQICAFVSTPSLVGGQWYGSLVVSSEKPRAWRRDEIELLRDVVARVYPVLERARAEKTLRQNELRFKGQKDAFEAAVAGAPLATSLDILIRTLVEQSDTDVRAAFYILDRDGTCLHPISGAGGMPEGYLRRIDNFKAGPDSIACGLSVASNEPVITRDVFDDPGWAPWLHLAREFDFRGRWSFPIKTQTGKSAGTLAMYHRVPREATPHDLSLASAITQAAAIIISHYALADERKRVNDALRESEERLRLLIESAEDYAIFTMTTDSVVNYWNAGAERIFGYSENEILGASAAILFTPEDRERGVPEEEMRTAMTAGRAVDERWHITKNGKRFYASGVMRPLLSGKTLRGFAKIARDLTAQKRAEEELQRAHDKLEERVRERTAELVELNQTLLTEVKERTVAEERARRFMRLVVTTQEDERRKLARDLHDHLGQQLTGLRLKLQNHNEACGDNEKLQTEVEEIQGIAEHVDRDVDFLAWELRPASLDEFGLAITLDSFVQEWSKHFGIPADFHTTGLDTARLPAEVEINLYRIAQEAMNNISKHAEAGGVDVLLERRESNVVLIIEDNGKGFDPEVIGAKPEGKKIGLLNMCERAAFVGGMVEIESHPGHGTTVFVRVPVSSLEPARVLKQGGSNGDD